MFFGSQIAKVQKSSRMSFRLNLLALFDVVISDVLSISIDEKSEGIG